MISAISTPTHLYLKDFIIADDGPTAIDINDYITRFGLVIPDEVSHSVVNYINKLPADSEITKHPIDDSVVTRIFTPNNRIINYSDLCNKYCKFLNNDLNQAIFYPNCKANKHNCNTLNYLHSAAAGIDRLTDLDKTLRMLNDRYNANINFVVYDRVSLAEKIKKRIGNINVKVDDVDDNNSITSNSDVNLAIPKYLTSFFQN